MDKLQKSNNIISNKDSRSARTILKKVNEKEELTR